jgi:hypothetical protein
VKKTLTLRNYQDYAEEVQKGLESSPAAMPKYPIRMGSIVKSGTTASGISLAPEMVEMEEVPGSTKNVNFKAGDGDKEFVLKYRTSVVKWDDPDNPGKSVTMEIPVVDMTDIKGFVKLWREVSELYSMMREFGLSVIATHNAFCGPVAIKHTGPQLAEKLTGTDGAAAYTVTQLKNAGKTQNEITDALKAIDAEKCMAVIRNAVHYNSLKSFIGALKEIEEQLAKAPSAPVITVADSPAEAVIHKTSAIQAEPIKVGEPVKPEKNTDILG